MTKHQHKVCCSVQPEMKSRSKQKFSIFISYNHSTLLPSWYRSSTVVNSNREKQNNELVLTI
uniref:Uncharacterized protein n=1 Tax=Rhizophora mucronata TaxID=61149 RepID=A0A2P2PWI7_RHIMU